MQAWKNLICISQTVTKSSKNLGTGNPRLTVALVNGVLVSRRLASDTINQIFGAGKQFISIDKWFIGIGKQFISA